MASIPLDFYRKFAVRLIDDISLLAEDLEFTKAGGRVLTAADFSEIYAYCHNTSGLFLSKRDSDLLSGVDARGVVNELHRAIMFFHMFETNESLWLLDPYIIELRRFIRNTEGHQFQRAVRAHAEAFGKLSAATNTPEFTALEAMVQRAQKSGKQLDANDQARLVAFVERVAPTAFYTDQQKPDAPIRRLRQLLEKNRLVIPSDPPMDVLKGDEATFERWRDALNHHRPGRIPANASDARAMAMLYSLNVWLLAQLRPQRLILLTRSAHMHSVMRNEVRAGHWDAVGGSVLRHPRGILALLDEGEIVRNAPIEKQERALEKWVSTLTPLIRTRSTPASAGSLTADEVVKRHVAVIAQVWQRYCGSKAVTIAVEHQLMDADKGLKAIALFLERGNLKRVIRERLNETEMRLSASTFTTATMISAEMDEARKARSKQQREVILPLEIEAGDERNLIQLAGANGTPMPFRVSIADARIATALRTNWADPFVAFQQLSEEQMLEPRDGIEGADLELEWYLSIAYVCAAMGAWTAALRACDFIVKMRERATAEILLMRAKATRNLHESLLELAPIANELRSLRAQSLPDTGISLRILTEQLKYEFIVARRAIDNKQDEIAEACIERAKRDIHFFAGRGAASTVEECELLNNIIYHVTQLNQRGMRMMETPEHLCLFQAFEDSLTCVYGPGPKHWPDNFVDTYCYVRLCLLRDGLLYEDTHAIDRALERAKILDPLIVVSQREHVSSVDEADYRLHAKEARTYFDGANR